MQNFFKDQVKNPQAVSKATGYQPYTRFSMAKDVYERNEEEVNKLVKQHNLKVNKTKNHVTFERK